MKKLFKIFTFFIFFNISLSISCEKFQKGCLKCNPLTNLCFRCENEVLIPDDQGGCKGAKICKVGHNYCEKCNSEQNLCEICENGYYQDNNGGCSYTGNCEISYNGDCLQCKENYILLGIRQDYDTLKICKSLSSVDLKNCQTVDENDGHCLKCDKGYNITNGDKKCTNTENCYEMENGECSSCVENYYLNKKEKKCIEIDDNKFRNCKNSLDGEKCSQCEENYFISDELICVNTNYCSKSEKNKCIQCQNGFYLTKNNQCTREEKCLEADPKNGICIKCIHDYYLDINNRQCISYSKDENNKYCAKSKDNCMECIEGYYLAGNKFCSNSKNCTIAKNGECKACEEGFFLNQNSNCVEDNHCISIDDNYECNECEDNYYYDKLNKKCKLVNSDIFKNCKFSDNSGTVCASCKSDFYIDLSDNLCYSNKDYGQFYKCIMSETGKNCTKCEKGFYLGYGDYQCTNVEGCFKSNEKNECQECELDYCFNKKTSLCEWNYLIEEESKKLFYKCKMTNEDATACVACEERFEVGNNGFCIDIIDCEKNIDGKCDKCINLDEEGNSHCLNKIYGCVETYNTNCTKCDIDLEVLTHCTECQEGYELDDTFQCVLIEKSEN